MAELFWFPLLVTDWLSSPAIARMLPEQEGAYIRLLVLAWGDGAIEPSLPDDAVQLAQMSRLGARWKKLGALVCEQFESRDGRLHNVKLSEVWRDQQEKYLKVVNKASAGGKASAAKRAAERSALSGATGSTTSTTQRSANTEAHVPEPKGSGNNGAAPDVAPAPEGARSPSLNGNYLDSPSAQDELRKRGHRPDPDAPRAPAPTLEENRAAVEVRQRQYDATLSNAASAWLVDHPEDAKEIWGECRVEMELPIEGTVSPLKMQSLRAAVVDRIRRREGWPTPDAWDGEPFTLTEVRS